MLSNRRVDRSMRSVTLTATDGHRSDFEWFFLVRLDPALRVHVACSAWSRSVTLCLSPVGVSKAVENINKIIAPALVSKVGHFTV